MTIGGDCKVAKAVQMIYICNRTLASNYRKRLSVYHLPLSTYLITKHVLSWTSFTEAVS